ncbi:MAG: ABC transporter permease [Deltaproteobacteria bacterium]|nr:ABC transporter permease [Deltaproteobacteria bacterium]MBW1961273.1 ABC transporter permease [Deltaproteobacteria bacterium]MBW1994608.1 ABC transporter permease [Deltaproteobacteria bacterium]MBW2151736.1 ABC transporter permease [Deltaproteobacteria bacterium]
MSISFENTELDRLSEDVVPSKFNLIFRKMWHLRLGVVGAVLLSCLIISAVFCPVLAPYDPFKQNIMKRLDPPVWLKGGSFDHLLGTDHLGRDILTRIMYGSRISLVVGVAAVMLQVLIGVVLGLLAGYYGGKIDSVISFMVNAMMGFPFILLAMSLVAVLGPSLQNIIIALGVTGWTVFTRVTRIETMKQREQEYVLAATSLAFTTRRILLRHVLPNLVPSLTVLATVEVARAIIRESLLSFLGLGIQPPTPSWGTMLAEGRDYMLMQWWLAALPGAAIFISALGINLLGDALRDVMDPHLRKS